MSSRIRSTTARWAGFDEAISQRDAEIKRLREIIERTIWDRRRPDANAEALSVTLDRRLRGR